MWLLNCANYRLEPNDPDGVSPKPYWILSHTWGDDEVTFQDMQNPTLAAQKKGFRKIAAMCELASTKGWTHVWIDTCCIDKTSSAELSESINSMFYWYKKSDRCIAYLEDLAPARRVATEHELRNCRWFTRGWTLQELIAPYEVQFYDSGWNARGTRQELARSLSNITKIDSHHLEFLFPDSLQSIPVARKMSWAAGRQTTRIEDRAYSLLGIFDVHMPLLYGEREQAFVRLQQTIAQKVNDMSLFAWIARPDDVRTKNLPPYSGLLASDPSQFAACAGFDPICDPVLPSPSWIITNAGIEITTALDYSPELEHTVITRALDNMVQADHRPSVYSFCYRLFLHCRPSFWHYHLGTPDQSSHGLALWLRKTPSGFVRFRPTELCLVKRSAMDFNDPGPIRIATSLTKEQMYDSKDGLRLLSDASFIPHTLRVRWDIKSRESRIEAAYHPAHLWDRNHLLFTNAEPAPGDGGWGSLTMGVVEITISNRPGAEPFSQRCWVFCGMVSGIGIVGPRKPRPWVQVELEAPGGSVVVLEKLISSRRELTNPFALSKIISVLREQGILPDPKPVPPVCIVRCTPTQSVRLQVSDFSFTGGLYADRAPQLTVTRAHQITITVEDFDPTLDSDADTIM